MRSVVLILAFAAFAPCTPGTNAQPEEPKEQPADAAKPSRTVLEEARTSVTVHMPDHLERATGIRDAVMFGRLPGAKTPAKYLSEHWPDQVLESWVPFVNGLRHAAGEIHDAHDIDTAGRATGSLALSCGRCHQAMDQGPNFDPAPPRPQAEDALMARHRWAADRLWEGVVQPSEERWAQGVAGLQEIPTCQDDLGGEQLTEAIEAARDATERVRLQAAKAKSLDERARLYGELIPTCSSCHQAGC